MGFWSKVKKIGSAAVGGLQSLGSTVASAATSAASTLASAATSAASTLVSAAKSAGSAAVSAVKTAASAIESGASKAIETVKDVAVTVKDKAVDTVVAVKDKVVDVANTVLDKASGALQTVQSKINTAIETVADKATGVYNAVLDKVEVVGSKVFDVANAALDKVGDGLKSIGFEKLGNFVSDLPENVGDHLQKFAEDLPANIAQGWEVVKDGVMNSLSKEAILAFVEGFASGGLIGAIGGAVATTVAKTVVQQIAKHQSLEEIDWDDIIQENFVDALNADPSFTAGGTKASYDKASGRLSIIYTPTGSEVMYGLKSEIVPVLENLKEGDDLDMSTLLHTVEALPTDTYSQEVLGVPVVQPSNEAEEEAIAEVVQVQRSQFSEVGIVPVVPAKYESIIVEQNSTWRGSYNTATRRALLIGLGGNYNLKIMDAK